MRTFAVAAALVVIASLDIAFSGFRASCGRTGLIRHRSGDIEAGIRGLALGAALLAVPAVTVVVDTALREHREAAYRHAGTAMLWVCVPYGLVVLASLAVYATLAWRLRFLASAVLLGPLTLVRPLIAASAALAACVAEPDILVGLVAAAAVIAVLAVEPLVGRIWYSPARVPTARALLRQAASGR